MILIMSNIEYGLLLTKDHAACQRNSNDYSRIHCQLQLKAFLTGVVLHYSTMKLVSFSHLSEHIFLQIELCAVQYSSRYATLQVCIFVHVMSEKICKTGKKRGGDNLNLRVSS